ncbi:hypothetical protein ACRAWG_06415 [Methylobacterium sp. P31]
MHVRLLGVFAGMVLALALLASASGAAIAAGGGSSGSGLDRGTEAARANDRTAGVQSGPGRRRYNRHYRHHRHHHYR